MNIFDYAGDFNADYYDPKTNYIYKVQDYNNAIKNGEDVDGIVVIDAITKNYVGIVKKPK